MTVSDDVATAQANTTLAADGHINRNHRPTGLGPKTAKSRWWQPFITDRSQRGRPEYAGRHQTRLKHSIS